MGPQFLCHMPPSSNLRETPDGQGFARYSSDASRTPSSSGHFGSIRTAPDFSVGYLSPCFSRLIAASMNFLVQLLHLSWKAILNPRGFGRFTPPESRGILAFSRFAQRMRTTAAPFNHSTFVFTVSLKSISEPRSRSSRVERGSPVARILLREKFHSFSDGRPFSAGKQLPSCRHDILPLLSIPMFS